MPRSFEMFSGESQRAYSRDSLRVRMSVVSFLIMKVATSERGGC